MSFSKSDLEKIKNKILLSSEIDKKTKVIKKGKDFWCCCPFHQEKTPSCKINDDIGTFYCFGCGAKGDIFTIYTDLYNYNFQDAVKELSQKAGVHLEFQDYKKNEEENKIIKILNISCEWFQKNLENPEAQHCKKYINTRKLTDETIKIFKLGFSYNLNSTLFSYLKDNSFKEEDILKSNVVKLDKNNKIRDYFYKRLIFPIFNEQNKIVGFGGRSLDETNPKYLNSPESFFFQKRNLLYNLEKAKKVARQKNNLLICEGYMDVISLHQNGIKSSVSPLGTSLTEDQLKLAWKYTSKPTLMFDGDNAGLKASYKSALMSLPILSSKRFLQFILLPNQLDPDSYINNFSLNDLIKLLKKPQPLVNFIFNQSSNALSLDSADEKVSYDKFLDDLIENIKDKKIQYFYKNELKSMFFNKIKKINLNKDKKLSQPKLIKTSLNQKQILSFITGCINHITVRKEIIEKLLSSTLFEKDARDLLERLKQKDLVEKKYEKIIKLINEKKFLEILNHSMDSSIYQLFPYSKEDFDDNQAYDEITKSCENLNTRLLNLKKINKSLDRFEKDASQLNWDELQTINMELLRD